VDSSTGAAAVTLAVVLEYRKIRPPLRPTTVGWPEKGTEPMHLSKQREEELLRKLADSEGFESVDDLIGAAVMDSVSPAICTECELTTEMEPDQTAGWCEACGRNTVVAAPVLAGII
jgi:hypothetical protein